MLILHPSSCCDVCLDAYTWQTIAQTPHAIPCGHVFCRPCLFALNPYICPLCRKKFEPNKAKKLHVDRPENVDENRENDLLQKLALSWEAPDDQLEQLMLEVDTWLDTRADDTCIVLRKARAALQKYLELKEEGTTLENALTDVRTRYNDMVVAYDAEHREAVAAETQLKADNDTLIRKNEELKAKVKELTKTKGHGPWKTHPLPPPPKPVSTEHLPTFAQAMAQEHERARLDLPLLSPTGSSPSTAQSFEVEGRKGRKGKTRSADRRLISPNGQNTHTLPTQLAKMDLSEESPPLISHFDPRQRRISTPAPSSGLQLHFENTSQPLDPFELTQTYLREYSQGVLDGQMMVEKATSRGSTSEQPPSTSHIHSDISLPDNSNNDTRSVRSTYSTQVQEIQPVSGPSTIDGSSRPRHRRQNTASSIATSAESSSTRQYSQHHSRSGSRPELNQTGHPSLSSLLSNNSSSAPSHGPQTLTSPPSPRHSNPSLPQLPSSHGQQQQPEPMIQPNHPRSQSPARSYVSKTSSWGTIISTSTNQTTYSLLGLRDFREGSYPIWSSPIPRVSSMVPAHESGASGDRNSSGRTNSQRSSQYLPRSPSWHGSVASLPLSPQDQSFSNGGGGYHSEDENEIVLRANEHLNSSYSSLDSMNNRRIIVESQHMIRRIQPLPAASPSFLLGESIITEEEDSLDQHLMETFGNALGLELTTGPTPISAPTPVVPHRSFLLSFSDET